ncbi:MAG: vancomycin resistance protein, partial [Cyanobacteriota bacterium]|nr:vancomycin resistance protein [Cyanobacteriota bacterium]
MQHLLQSLKGTVRHTFKSIQNLKQGYPQYYARIHHHTNIKEFQYMWGQCITPIKQRTGAVDINENRYWNMQLAIDYIQGLIFQPGEIFSFWDQI